MKKVISAFRRERNKKFYVYVEYLDEVSGKRKQENKGSFESKKDADKLLIKLKNDINNNKYSVPTSITFVNRCYKYYETKVNHQSPNTTKTCNRMIKNHIETYFKQLKVSDLTVAKFQDFINILYSSSYAPKTIELIRNITVAVLHECYRLKEINENIPDFIIYPKLEKHTDDDIFTLEETKLILEKCKDYKYKHLELPINLFAFAGLRSSEIWGLSFDDIDFDNNIINVKQILIYNDGEFIRKKPKTPNSVRSLLVPKHIIDLISEERRRQNILKGQGYFKKTKHGNKHNLICLNSNNDYIESAAFSRAFKTFVSSIDIKYRRPYKLRHMHSTLLILGGTDIKTISKRLGHSDIKITMNTYSHVLNEMDTQAVENIKKILL